MLTFYLRLPEDAVATVCLSHSDGDLTALPGRLLALADELALRAFKFALAHAHQAEGTAK